MEFEVRTRVPGPTAQVVVMTATAEEGKLLTRAYHLLVATVAPDGWRMPRG
jgi:hypothetical protein